MYPLNVNMSSANLLGVESACNTPRTPEILNSLIAMTNPLDYSFADNVTGGISTKDTPNGADSNSSSSSPLGSPANGNPPNLQQTLIKSQLIKAGLKLSIQNKRKNSGSEGDTPPGRRAKMPRKDDPGSGSDDDYGDSNSPSTGLTPEDEERRRRRRERNKIAATKCRLKKRERTVNLVTESEVLENQNIDLKTQIQELETQRRQLVDMLSMHGPSCIKTQTSSPTTGYVNYSTYTDTFLHNTDPNLNSLSPTMNDLNSLNYDKIDNFATTPDSFQHTTSVTNVQTKLELPEMSARYSSVTSTGGILSDINTNNFIGPNGSELAVPKIEVVNFDIGEEENKYTDLDEFQSTYSTVSNTTQYNDHDLNHNNGCMA